MKKLSLRTYSVITLIVVLVIIAVIGVLLNYHRVAPPKAIASPPPPPVLAYGIRLDSMDIVYGRKQPEFIINAFGVYPRRNH